MQIHFSSIVQVIDQLAENQKRVLLLGLEKNVYHKCKNNKTTQLFMAQ